MHRYRRILVTFGGALLAVVLLASAASAAAVSKTDPKGDGRGAGDVRALRLSQSGATFTARVRTEKPLNADTAPAWQNEGSRSILRIYLDTRTDTTGPDYVFVMDNDAGFLRARLLQLTAWRPSEGGCVPTIQQPQLTQIQLSVDIACIGGDGSGVRGYATYRFDKGGNGTQDSIDRAPNTGTTAPLFFEP